MKLTIIIPNFNGAHFLKPCLDSLRSQTFQDFKILLIDNGSSDESLSLVESGYPEVSILKFSHNRGFAAAVNTGIRAADTPYIMTLNNDTLIEPHCIGRLMAAIQTDPRIFSAGALILSRSVPVRTDTSGDFYNLFGYAFCRDQGLPMRRRPCRNVFTNCGCACIYRRELLQETGLFDPRFFAYLEDVDLGIRARLLGYRNICCQKAIVYHTGSGTTGSKYTSLKVFCSARNNIWLRQKNLSMLQRLFHAPLFFGGTVAKYLYFHKMGLHLWYLRGILQGIRHPIQPENSFAKVSPWRLEPWIFYGTVLYVFQYLRRRLIS